MSISRRGFVAALTSSAAALFVARHLPVLLPATTRRTVAIEFLAKAWNAHMRGKSSRKMPEAILAGRDLFDAFEGEMMTLQRETNQTYLVSPTPDYPLDSISPALPLVFKASRLYRSTVRGWWVGFNAEGVNAAGTHVSFGDIVGRTDIEKVIL